MPTSYTNLNRNQPTTEYLVTELLENLMTEDNEYIITNQSTAWGDPGKNTNTFSGYLRHGVEPSMGDLANYTFQSVVFEDGTVLQNLTFEQLQDVVWNNINKS